MGENRKNTTYHPVSKSDGYEVNLWCKTLNMTPSQLLSTPKEDIKNRLKTLKHDAKLNLAKKLLAYQRKKRAKCSTPNEIEDKYQEEDKQNEEIQQIFNSGVRKNKKAANTGEDLTKRLDRIKAGGYVSSSRRVVGNNVYETSRRVDGNNVYETKHYSRNTPPQKKRHPQSGPYFDNYVDNYYRGRAGGNVAGRALAQACEDMEPCRPAGPTCPQLFESYKGSFGSDTESSYEPSDPYRARTRSLPFNATPPGEDDGCYAVRGFDEMEMRDSNVDEGFNPHPVLQSTPARPMMMRPVIQQVGSFVAEVSEDSLEMSDINVTYESNPCDNSGKLQITTRSYLSELPDEGEDYGNQSCPGQIEDYGYQSYADQGQANISCPAEIPGQGYTDPYQSASGGGSPCPLNRTYNASGGGSPCAPNRTYNASGGGSPCAPNRTYNASGGGSPCPLNITYNAPGGGSPCPLNRTYNASGGGSPCPLNRTYNASGGGSPGPLNKTYNASGGGSPCAPNRTFNASGGGSPCPLNRTYNASGGGSPCPLNRTYNASGGGSPCPLNRTYNASGGGSPCPLNKTFNASGGGSPCPMNTTYNMDTTFETCPTWDVSANRCSA